MRLNGLNIPHAQLHCEPTASNRIHTRAQGMVDPATILSYDNLDIAAALSSTGEDGKGILRALQQGKCYDRDNKPIDNATILQELLTLSEDLKTVANNVERIFRTEEGLKRWPQETPQLGSRSISIPDEINQLRNIAEQFNGMAETLGWLNGAKNSEV